MATGALAVAVWWGLGPEAGLSRWLARSWARGLEHQSSERIASDMRYIAALDTAGLDTLLDAMGSTRSVVAESAAQALQERLIVWRQWPAERSGPLAKQLARKLAERIGGWPATSQRVAADVALELLDWPIADVQISDATLLVDCERILRIVPLGSTVTSVPSALFDGVAPSNRGTETGQQPGLLSPAPGTAPKDQRLETEPIPEVVSAGQAIQPALTEQSSEDAAVSHDLNPPLLAGSPSDHTAGGSATGSDRRADDSDLDERTGLASTRPNTSLFSAEKMAVENPATDGPSRDLRDTLAKRSELDLIYDWGGSDEDLSVAAKAELRRRGFRNYEFRLAEKLISPDPTERRQVAHLVQGLTSGASRWLIWLSQDPDRSVRQAAVAIMFTAQDPQIQQRLLKMEVTDEDSVICERIRVWRERR